MAYCYHCMTKLDSPDMPFCPECGQIHSQPQVQNSELPVGTMLSNSRYIVGECLNTDSFSMNYIGIDLKMDKKVSIKEIFFKNISSRDNPNNDLRVIHNDSLDFSKIKNQISRECIMLSEANSLANIAKILDWFEENNTEYIVCEYISDTSLEDLVKEDNGYEWSVFYELFRPLLNSLQLLHDYNIYHKNIKPSNIKVRQKPDNTNELVLTDFGFAHPYAEDELDITSDSPYEPVEQRNHAQNDSSYTDVYACAATIYFVITAHDPLIKLTKHIDEIFPLLRPYRTSGKIPENVYYALKYGLQPDFKVRCQSISTFIERLNRTHQPVTVKTGNPTQPKPSRELADRINSQNTPTQNTQANTKYDDPITTVIFPNSPMPTMTNEPTQASFSAPESAQHMAPPSVDYSAQNNTPANEQNTPQLNSKRKIFSIAAAVVGCLLVTALLITGISMLTKKDSDDSKRASADTKDTASRSSSRNEKSTNSVVLGELVDDLASALTSGTENKLVEPEDSTGSTDDENLEQYNSYINDAIKACQDNDYNQLWNYNNIDLATVRDVCVDKEIDMETYVLVWKDESTVEFVRVNEYDNDNENIINFDIPIRELSDNISSNENEQNLDEEDNYDQNDNTMDY